MNFKEQIARLCGCFLLTVLIFTACSEDDDDLMQAPTSAIDKAQALISGTITESESEIEDGVLAWKIDITTDQGAEVEIYYRQDNGELLRIDGENGPYDYNINPGSGLIDFSQAKTIAMGAVSGTLIEWQLKIEDKFDNIWVYSMEFDGNQVYINATDGSVLEVES